MPHADYSYTSLGIRKELAEGMQQLIAQSGAKSLAAIVSVMSSQPELFAEMLRPHVQAWEAQQKARRAGERETRERRQLEVTKALLAEGRSDLPGETPADADQGR